MYYMWVKMKNIKQYQPSVWTMQTNQEKLQRMKEKERLADEALKRLKNTASLSKLNIEETEDFSKPSSSDDDDFQSISEALKKATWIIIF